MPFLRILVKIAFMKPPLLLLCCALLYACGPTIAIDFEKNQDFSGFKTYQFYPDIDSGLNELDDKRITATIDSVLQQRGFIKTDSNRFFINFYAAEGLSRSRNTIGIGVGGGGRRGGVGVSGGIPIGGNVVRQQLTIDFVDAEKDQSLVWQAVIDGEYKEKASPRQKDTYYYSVLSKALQKFPPKNK